MGQKKKSLSTYYKYTYVIHIFTIFIGVYDNKTNILSTRRHAVSGLQEKMIRAIYTFMCINISFWIVFRFQPLWSTCRSSPLAMCALWTRMPYNNSRCKTGISPTAIFKERKRTWLSTGNVYLFVCLLISRYI